MKERGKSRDLAKKLVQRKRGDVIKGMRETGWGNRKKIGGCQRSRDTSKPKHGRAAVIGADHPSGLAERLSWLDCGLLAGLDAWMNELRDGDRLKSCVVIQRGQCAGNIKYVNGKHTCYHQQLHAIKVHRGSSCVVHIQGVLQFSQSDSD